MAPSNNEKEKPPKVKPFLRVRIRRFGPKAHLLGLCAGYEAGAWRADAFVKSPSGDFMKDYRVFGA